MAIFLQNFPEDRHFFNALDIIGSNTGYPQKNIIGKQLFFYPLGGANCV
ncbi:hypothetical protein NIES970_25890 [[Synechococcus] sp. NIES-970]|nr:hypothetical protein NIES970_25890 [[Synechococcus] sp. NIES-970]